MNEVKLIGRAGSDAEFRHTPAGTPMLSISLATSERRGDATETQWHQCEIFGNLAERYRGKVKKGDEVLVFGKIWSRTYKDQNNIQKTQFSINGQKLRILKPLSEMGGFDNAFKQEQNSMFRSGAV